ncbi:MAG TPA: glucose 1-dehydrogenase [Xanthobacteraceae bacterium]|jgi:threonine dehydrogenase-like Zn-dependent dehydrogenase|nr:glucose 1-dehydrogenase [Xanthobacteraceae bacterium]
MRALTVAPGIANSARLDDIPEPPASDGAVLVRTLALGVCGTDRDIVAGDYGWPPPGQKRLVIGHESLGHVKEAPAGCGFKPGDLVVGIVRRPDPVPCPACAVGEWDMCRNGLYTERGIKERNGYGSDVFRIEPEFLIKLDPSLGMHGVLVEPTSVVAKAWDHIERIGRRSRAWQPRTLLVTGAGPIGLLAAMIGAQRGLEVHVLDHNESMAKQVIVRELGGTLHLGRVGDLNGLKPDILMECTGVPSVVRDALGSTAAAGIVCLVGVSAPGHDLDVDIGEVNRTMVLDNDTVFGSVNANRQHYEDAVAALQCADKNWLARLITRCVPVEQWTQSLVRQPGDIKVVVDFS